MNPFVLVLRTLALPILMVALAACSQPQVEVSPTQQMVDKAIAYHGGQRYDNARIKFSFRGTPFVVEHNNGMFSYKRTYSDTSGSIVEILSNEGFKRTADGNDYQMSKREFNIWTEAVNSVVYFALLPYKLNDPAVVKRSLGQEVVEGQPYERIEVTFNPEGGGRDHDDRFVYWFHSETGAMDFLAYHYTQRGTSRFRKAVNVREVGGIRFADYLNFTADTLGYDVELAAKAFEDGALPLLSEIVLDNVTVEALDSGESD